LLTINYVCLNINRMKVGKLPVAPIIMIALALTSFVLQRIYPGEYKFDSPFISGAFFWAILVYFLYYVNVWITASANNKKEAEEDPAV
jgi:hypothetical protein